MGNINILINIPAMYKNTSLYLLQSPSHNSYENETNYEWSSVYDMTITQLFKSKRELIMDRVSKSKKSLLNKLQADQFPVPSQERRNQFYRSMATPCNLSS